MSSSQTPGAATMPPSDQPPLGQPAHETGTGGPGTDDNQASSPETTGGRPTIQIKGQGTSLRPTLSHDPSVGSSTQAGSSASDSTVRTWQGRRGSASSLSFVPMGDELPQGTHKKTDKERIKASSPPPSRFQSRVTFDNMQIGEATKRNTTSFTLNVRHHGYQFKRRSRTFMVGVDEHDYSDSALQWLLDEMVDDGDEVVCVRVTENVNKGIGSYQSDAQALMDSIIAKNGANRAINFILEYAVGKLHATFHKLIQMYQPAMLVVGTRGRSLGGIQGLVNTRNSFSKYCLQYSPIPVVVVRPTEERVKKRTKRRLDAERQTYAKMLTATGGKHETDSTRTRRYATEVKHSEEQEAHYVARALGLPATFDPTVKPLNIQLGRRVGHQVSSSPSPLSSNVTAANEEGEEKTEKEEVPETGDVQLQVQTEMVPTTVCDAGDDDDNDGDGDGDGEDEDEGDDDDNDNDDDGDEDGFEAISGEQALDQDQQDRLHHMEMGEAAALLQQNRRQGMGSGDTDDESDDGAQAGGGGSKD
ncbi:hypothetical protein ACRALDRAFT_1077590 [Sodiomyces alcalophilus JCM 7366]|uniref:uncharacterized protein n=1 Tax=Sodiomyces alcalophilus JCM 7366 TaxID=591952 RepID=UPI0039B45381